ncbi:hypothetical protein [Vibrio crassostreae]|uniref:hypothetical protein n=1 Tax=Vibrio crassostreae TaxID=246167 RepID=UPI001B31194F|nr:hypothetical protein [Vibrio crassostreae]
MTSGELYKELLIVEEQLTCFVSPMCQFGFYESFVNWVIENWGRADNYGRCKMFMAGTTTDHHPESERLKDAAATYTDFLQSNSKNPKNTSGVIGSNKPYQFRLLDKYEQECLDVLDALNKARGLKVPDDYRIFCSSVIELVLLNPIPKEIDPELFGVCSRLCDKINVSGASAALYTTGDCGVFNNHTLWDFIELRLELNSQRNPTPRQQCENQDCESCDLTVKVLRCRDGTEFRLQKN